MSTESLPSALQPVTAWALQMENKGILSSENARQAITSLSRLVSVLDPSESADPEHVLSTLDAITDRWTRKTAQKPTTAKTYRAKARTLLEQFLSWQRDPVNFKVKASTPRPPRAKAEPVVEAPKDPIPPPTVKSPQETIKFEAPPDEANKSKMRLRSFPLPNGREIEFREPGDMEVREIFKFALHLITMAKDFDPFDPAQANWFAMTKSSSQASPTQG
jgi:hypothetical protein